ncbi:MAG: FAD-dependent oxidoreductase [Steroidobacteraceae bacterium]|nr:FAD-dependent oxidoreductase [Steroidobacteraceae bacterium]
MPRALLVFSHLRWNFVYQRPQHLVSRLGRHYRTWFVEEPVEHEGTPHLRTAEVAPNVVVCRPHLPGPARGFHEDHLEGLRPLLQRLVEEEVPPQYAAWFYTPMALPLLDVLRPERVVYDCMDELSAFLGAPRELVQRERALLQRADMVFTGGISLYRSKRELHPGVHCFPSSVDAAHFARARDGEPDAAVRALPGPRLGYFGVIDERVDLGLVAALADAHPEWSILMVGPVVKIAEDSLPRRPNIHYLGQRPYEQLPALVAGWDVCLLPFAMNDATRYISPTKTLEYMAAGRPIVGTPVPDVVESHGDIVRIASTPAGFVSACEAALAETPRERERRERAMSRRVATTSWDATAERMRSLLESGGAAGGVAEVAAAARDEKVAAFPAAESRPRPAAAGGRGAPSRAGQGAAAAVPEYDAVVIGAGPTGLSAAYHIGAGSLLLDANETIGGWCRSIRDRGFTFDYAGHIMFSNDPYVHQMYRRLLGDNVHWQNREAWIYSKGVYTRYPFQGALYGLPADVLKECIVGAIEARYGSLGEPPPPSRPAAAAPASSSTCVGKAESITDCCADGVAEGTVPLVAAERVPRGAAARGEPQNFEEFIYKVWGAGVAKHFAIPYNRKLWAVPLSEMETSWLGGRVPLPNLEEMIDGALRPVPKPVGPNARFGYPLRGGFQALMNGFLPLLKGELQLNARVVQVSPSRRELQLADGRRYRYRQLVSTAPLPELVRMCGEEAPREVLEAVGRLRHVSVRCVNLGIARPNITEKHWIYYPEDTVFHRIFVQGNASPHCNPPGGFGLTCEITYAPTKPLPCDGDALIERCIEDCVRVGMLRPDDAVIARNQVDMPYAYVVYDHARKASFEVVRDWLAQYDVILSGRYSEWQYYNSDHAFLAGKQAADAALGRLGSQVTVDAG